MSTTLVLMKEETQSLAVQGQDTRTLPALFAPDARAAERFVEFFTAHIRNPHTRRAYFRAAQAFAAWCAARGVAALHVVKPLHVAAYIEGLPFAKPTVKQHLAA